MADSPTDADEFLERGVSIGARIVPIAEIDWLAFEKQTLGDYYAAHTWNFVDALILAYHRTKRTDYLRHALTAALRWIEQFMVQGREHEFTWHDMTAGLRAAKLPTLLVFAARSGASDAELDSLVRTAHRHVEVLSERATLARHSNHALFQLSGLLALTASMPASFGYDGERRYALRELNTLLDAHFTSEGVHKEHSPDYHVIVANVLHHLVQSGWFEDAGRIALLMRRAAAAVPWMLDPSQRLMPLGDTNTLDIRDRAQFVPRGGDPLGHIATSFGAAGRSGPLSSQRCARFPEAGLAVFRTGWAPDASVVQLTGWFHSRIHKHADDLGLNVYIDGRPYLIEAGFYKGVYDDPFRQYCESVRAHNTLEVVGKPVLRGALDAYGGAIEFAESVGVGFAADGRVKRPEAGGDASHERVVLFLPGKLLAVCDTFVGKDSEPIAQWSHFHSDLEVASADGGLQVTDRVTGRSDRILTAVYGDGEQAEVTIHSGETDPEINGWTNQSGRSGPLTPRTSVAVRTKGRRLSILAVYVFGNPDLSVDAAVKSAGRFVRVCLDDAAQTSVTYRRQGTYRQVEIERDGVQTHREFGQKPPNEEPSRGHPPEAEVYVEEIARLRGLASSLQAERETSIKQLLTAVGSTQRSLKSTRSELRRAVDKESGPAIPATSSSLVAPKKRGLPGIRQACRSFATKIALRAAPQSTQVLLGLTQRMERQAHALAKAEKALAKDLRVLTKAKNVVLGSSAYAKPDASPERESRLDFAPYTPRKLRLPTRPNLTIACILDEFSHECFAPEANFVQLTRLGWRDEIEAARPAFLLVESAWRGGDKSWEKVLTGQWTGRGAALQELLAYCRERGIPTVFWNKEDPPNFEHFIDAARQFDHVFTTDEGCLARYRLLTEARTVAVLPFAAQPVLHNPIRPEGVQKLPICFAGTYYNRKHDSRKVMMESLLAPSLDFGLHIFDRKYHHTESGAYVWPDKYQPSIMGGLSYSKMLTAYRAYKVFLNVNSVSDSETMFSRRVFELMACGTSILSTPSRGQRAMFGRLIYEAGSPEQARGMLELLLRSDAERDAIAHLGYREVMTHHTYAARLDTILRAIGAPVGDRRPRVTIVVLLRGEGADGQALEQAKLQVGGVREVVAAKIAGAPTDLVSPNVPVFEGGSWKEALMNALGACASDYVTLMDPRHRYGAHFLSDLVLPLAYTDAALITKARHYRVSEEGAKVLPVEGPEHAFIRTALATASLISREVFGRLVVAFGDGDVDEAFGAAASNYNGEIYASDRYGFLRDGARAAGSTLSLQELETVFI